MFKEFQDFNGNAVGSCDFEAENEPITLATSSEVVWDRSIELKLQFQRNLEKLPYEGGIQT